MVAGHDELDTDHNTGDTLHNVSNVEVGSAQQAYQRDLRSLVINSMPPSFTINERGSDGTQYDTCKHRWESLAKVPYLLDLDRSKTVQNSKGTW